MIPIVEFQEREEKLRVIFSRSASFSRDIDAAVRVIIEEVRLRGDAALLEFGERFDKTRALSLRVPQKALEEASACMDPDLQAIIAEAAANIRRFHEKQMAHSWFTEDGDGVVLGQRIAPIERVGLYVPGGKAFYPSSLLMNAIPAQVAGVPEIHLVSPPDKTGLPNQLVLATAHFLGLEHVYTAGGAQAIAALAYGTETLPRVDKIVGPGNAYVAAAKKLVFGPVSIDSVAGPSEIAILADASADPEFVAADLLSQAEHDERSSAVLITTHRPLVEAVLAHIEQMFKKLERKAILEKSLSRFSACIICETMEEALTLVNELAPEHLEIMAQDPWGIMTRVRHAGAIFLGPYSSEPVGDYFAGPNHVLPTGGTARYASALSVDDFLRKQSVISYTPERLAKTGPHIVRFALSEELQAHAQAIQVRLDRIQKMD